MRHFLVKNFVVSMMGCSTFLTSQVFAESILMNSSGHCYSSEIKKNQVSLFPDRQNSPLFSYSYKRFASTSDTAKTTVIILPGGPGDTLLERTPTEGKFPYGAVSTDRFHIIYTEPRGLGCNQVANGDFPNEAFRIEYLAQDVLAIIRNENLRDYIIYGASFGTVHASYVAHLIEKSQLPRPKAIVLEGTLGKGVPGKFTEYISGFSNEWTRVKQILPPQMANFFAGSSLPLGYSSEVWGAFIFKQLIAGDVPNYGPWLQFQLLPLLTGDATGLKTLKTALEGYKLLLSYSPLSRIPRIFQVLGCQELFGGWLPEVRIDNGELSSGGQNICGSFNYTPYDSSQLSISSPIIYFQGPYDPATPLTSALYHFDHQKRSERKFVTVSGASHAPLSNSLTTLGCNGRIWAQIETDPQGLSKALATCQNWNIDLKAKAPGE